MPDGMPIIAAIAGIPFGLSLTIIGALDPEKIDGRETTKTTLYSANMNSHPFVLIT